ncbi:hypothetical protein BS47DRAFT_1395553 [Hydnum rufescens UP504]|uniref:Uncharacterized protein n=1 Tax=Hydnum rufescens UP504 TaxID=1448309 RepID=A0A9P6AT07_9AGAM|nr:hypothetical protein BS47DRAFT_1395553 [Hydnum rufescens UP504]
MHLKQAMLYATTAAGLVVFKTPSALWNLGQTGVCSICRRFNIRCFGVGQDFPRPSGSKRAAKAISKWVARSTNRNPDTESSIHLVINLEPVTAQKASERQEKPPTLLTDSFNCGIQIARQARDLGRFGTPLTSIANCTFAICQLLSLCIPPNGHLFPPHPTEGDYCYASIVTTGLLFLHAMLRYISDLLLKGPLHDASVMEQAFGIILAYLTDLKESLKEAKQAVDMGGTMKDVGYILGLTEATSTHDLDTAGDGVGIGLGPRSDDAGIPGQPGTFDLAPETREDEPSVELSSPSCDPAGSRSRVSGDDGLRCEHGSLPPHDTCVPLQVFDLSHVHPYKPATLSSFPPTLFPEPGKTSADGPLIE